MWNGGGRMGYGSSMENMDVRKFIGGNLRRVREGVGETQGQFAERLNTDQGSISKWETGAALPRLTDMVHRLEAAGINPMGLFLDGEPLDPDVRRAVDALKMLPSPMVGAIADALETMRPTTTHDDPEIRALIALLNEVEPHTRHGVISGIRATVQSLISVQQTPLAPSRSGPPSPNRRNGNASKGR